MLPNLFVTAHGKRSGVSEGNDLFSSNGACLKKQTAETTCDSLYKNARSGLRGLLIFLSASAIAFYFNERTPGGSIPVDIIEFLGSAPPVILVNCVFGASTVSSLISIAGRIYHNLKPGRTATHLIFRLFFYLLYFIAGALGDYFNVVFISGLVVLGLQHYNVWNYYMRAIAKKETGAAA